MSSSNVDRFNAYAGVILGQLYQQFPERCALDAFVLAGVPQGQADEFGATPKEVEFVALTLRWLADSGFLLGHWAEHGMVGATLSVKGLEALKSIPSSVHPSRSIGDQLVSALGSGVKDAVAKTAGLFFVEVFRTLFR